ncbi:hypothetical protein [Xenorhabdus doucetiae]|uniref:hypothetical protein n=1 Tax=Xenorhabdus doucetiae TaxID=351671 RepID=UPI0038CDC2BC
MPDKAKIIAKPLAKKTPLMGGGYLEDSHFYQCLFNGNNAERYLENAYKAIVKINRILRQTNKPFSSVLPKELSPLFFSVNLDNPLDSWGLVLEELEHLYIKDAVHFHHPKYVTSDIGGLYQTVS